MLRSTAADPRIADASPSPRGPDPSNVETLKRVDAASDGDCDCGDCGGGGPAAVELWKATRSGRLPNFNMPHTTESGNPSTLCAVPKPFGSTVPTFIPTRVLCFVHSASARLPAEPCSSLLTCTSLPTCSKSKPSVRPSEIENVTLVAVSNTRKDLSSDVSGFGSCSSSVSGLSALRTLAMTAANARLPTRSSLMRISTHPARSPCAIVAAACDPGLMLFTQAASPYAKPAAFAKAVFVQEIPSGPLSANRNSRVLSGLDSSSASCAGGAAAACTACSWPVPPAAAERSSKVS